MRIRDLAVGGALLLEPESAADRRGFFTRGWCRWLLEERGLEPALARTVVAVHHASGEVRSPRCMAAPWQEAMLARCTRGAAHLVLVDLRAAIRPAAVHLDIDADSRSGVYIPPGVALGYQTLQGGTEMFLQHAEMPPKSAIEHLLDAAGVAWPLPVAG